MTVADFLNALMKDDDICISIQSRANGRVNELYNSEKLFGNQLDSIEKKEISYIKVENKSIFIIV